MCCLPLNDLLRFNSNNSLAILQNKLLFLVVLIILSNWLNQLNSILIIEFHTSKHIARKPHYDPLNLPRLYDSFAQDVFRFILTFRAITEYKVIFPGVYIAFNSNQVPVIGNIRSSWMASVLYLSDSKIRLSQAKGTLLRFSFY